MQHLAFNRFPAFRAFRAYKFSGAPRISASEDRCYYVRVAGTVKEGLLWRPNTRTRRRSVCRPQRVRERELAVCHATSSPDNLSVAPRRGPQTPGPLIFVVLAHSNHHAIHASTVLVSAWARCVLLNAITREMPRSNSFSGKYTRIRPHVLVHTEVRKDEPLTASTLSKKSMANCFISSTPRRMMALFVFVPSPKPSQNPAARAITFLTAPQTCGTRRHAGVYRRMSALRTWMRGHACLSIRVTNPAKKRIDNTQE